MNAGVPARTRFEMKLLRTDLCWHWLGCKNADGYGSFHLGTRAIPAHRAAYILFVGDIPAGRWIDHLCRRPNCVNPAHLEAVTPGENTRRGLYGALKRTCARGHPWVPENIATNGPGKQCCAVCHRERERERKRRVRAELRAAMGERLSGKRVVVLEHERARELRL